MVIVPANHYEKSRTHPKQNCSRSIAIFMDLSINYRKNKSNNSTDYSIFLDGWDNDRPARHATQRAHAMVELRLLQRSWSVIYKVRRCRVVKKCTVFYYKVYMAS